MRYQEPATRKELDLFTELKEPKNKKALEKLKQKAKWEQSSLFSVLRNWGDPRNWP